MEEGMMPIVQMVKLRPRENKTSQLAKLGCVSRYLFFGLNHIKTKVSPQETGYRAVEGYTVSSSNAFLHLDFHLRAMVPGDHSEHLGWLWERSKPQVVKTIALVSTFADFCDQLLQRRHFKSLLELS